MNVSSIDQSAAVRSYTKVVNRHESSLGDERIQVVIRRSRDGASHEVGLFNHSHREHLVAQNPAAAAQPSRSTLGYVVPIDRDADAFVDALLADYVAPVTIEKMLFGLGFVVKENFDAVYSEEVAEAATRHLIETGYVARPTNEN